MNHRLVTEASRRQFLGGSARYLLLGGVLACGALVTTGRRTTPGGACLNAGICQGCSVFARCDLPNAVTAKQIPSGREP